MKNSNFEMFLGVNFDNNLSFDEHISDSCKKASGKDHALVTGMPYMTIPKRCILAN